MIYLSRFSLSHFGRILLFAPIGLLTACASMAPASYPPVNTHIGEIKEWRMPLNREPGNLQFDLHIPRNGSTQISLFSAQRLGESPIRISFAGSDCASGPEAHIKFYTSNTESHFKYFRAPLQWEKEVTVTIAWDKNAQTSISVNGEMITVQPHLAFEEIQIRNNKEAIKIKRLQYTASLMAKMIPTRAIQNQTQDQTKDQTQGQIR